MGDDYFEPGNEELLRDFFLEAEGQLAAMEQAILALEDNHHDTEAIDGLFRAAHTLKGGAATVQIGELESFTHKVEDLLDLLREGKFDLNSEIVDTLLESLDIIRLMIAEREQGRVFAQDISLVQSRLIDWVQKGGHRQVQVSEPPVAPAPATEIDLQSLWQNCGDGEQVLHIRVSFNPDQPMNTIGQVQVYARLKDFGADLCSRPDIDELAQDQFYQQVSYYLRSSSDPEDLRQKLHTDNVTVEIEVEILLPAEEQPQPPESEKLTAPKPPSSTADAQAEPTSAPPTPPSQGAVQQEKPQPRSQASATLRVDSRRVDLLLNLVSEAVINKAAFNQISQQLTELHVNLQQIHTLFKNNTHDFGEQISQQLQHQGIDDIKYLHNFRHLLGENLQESHQALEAMGQRLKNLSSQFSHTVIRLSRNTSDMHESILSMRMVPIGQIFSRFPRLVRDLSRTLGKKIQLQLEGEATEIDKSVVEELTDPLMHCVRNSVDHGIESVATRLELGKPESGTIRMCAANEGNMVVIEVSDDGKGISIDAVRDKALAKGLLSPGKALSDQEAFNLIFAPGFSTAKEVTNLSGRGVGLDVVKRQIERLNGSISIWSIADQGSKFTIKLPLTLAIIQGLLAQVGSEIYAIPITAVSESLRIRSKDIHKIDDYEVVKVRGKAISLLRLSKLFHIPSQAGLAHFFAVVVGGEERRIALMVDNLLGEEDVVIKPLQDRYTNSPGIAGATILGDGQVALILDVSKLLDLGLEYERYHREKSRRFNPAEQE